MKFLSESLADTRAAAETLLAEVSARASKSAATVVVCSGNLGSGKTAFAKELARALGVRERVTSPTFVLARSYAIPSAGRSRYGFERLFHIDAYRLDDPAELETIGFPEAARDPRNLILVEWGERFLSHLPSGYRRIHFTFVDETKRRITLKR